MKDFIKQQLTKRDTLKKRSQALLIDLYVVIFSTKILIISYKFFLQKFMFMMGEKNIDLLSAPSWRLEFSMTGLIFVSYFFLGYYLGNGRTIGKSFFKLKVLPQNKETLELSAMESMIRSLCYTLSLFSGFFLFLLPVFRKDNLGLADILSGSSIVSESDASFSNASIEVQAQLEFNFEQEPLSEEMLTFLPKFKRPANKKSA